MIKVEDVCAYGLKNHFIAKGDMEAAEKAVDMKQVEVCREFINKYLKPHRIGDDSYRFKHLVERVYGQYITNGAFIVAAILEGCKVATIKLPLNRTCPNVTVRITYRSKEIENTLLKGILRLN